MRFLLDEHIDLRLGDHLSNLGHDVTSVARDRPRAIQDEEILALALGEQRILITQDLDFDDLVFREQRSHAGVVLLRLRDDRLEQLRARLEYVLSNHAGDLNRFVTVDRDKVRVSGA